jgi:uncharacterized protein YegP (UPF0339 family)
MGKLLVATADWVFIGVVAAIALIIAILFIIYFKVKGRANLRALRCASKEDEGPSEGTERDDEITEGAEDEFVSASMQEPASSEVSGQTENNGGADEVESSGESSASWQDETEEVVGSGDITVQTVLEEDGYRFYVKGEGGQVLGASELYKSRAGALKGIKSLVNYTDAEVCDEGDGKPCPKFELFSEGQLLGYRLLAKNRAVKLSWADFADEQSRLYAIETIKKLLPKLLLDL